MINNCRKILRCFFKEFHMILQVSKKSKLELTGRTDGNMIVVFPNEEVECESGVKVRLKPGDYTHVKVSCQLLSLNGS